MNWGTVGQEYEYDLSEEKFQKAFAFLHRNDLAGLEPGWIELGDGISVSVQHYVTAPADQLKFETHNKFFDIQYLIEGREFVGCCARAGLNTCIPYDDENDIEFYDEPDHSGEVLLEAGDYAVLSPDDAHKPRCAAGEPMAVKKLVIKVPV